jgi:20S proteasome alpha/beta subunit
MTRAMRAALEEFGPTLSEDNSADMLIAHRGQLFEYSTADWSVSEVDCTAIGSGNLFALGSLYSTRHYTSMEKRVRMALEAATALSPTCSAPIDVLSTI